MLYIALPKEENRRLVFYLAMEEYVARFLNEDDCFFMWQSDPTVIFGRNQLIENEVNMDYCRTHGIQTYRRKSGGGCVYSDRSNVMFSYIAKDERVNFTFNRYINMLVLVLHRLGVNAQASGRNDILIDGKKVSGNAFYHIPGRSIVHGTMLYDTNMEHMVGSITPNNEKLLSKGVQSVRQHIALLKDHLDITIDEFKTFIRKNLCDREITLSEEAVQKIEEIEQEYLTDSFIYGNNPRYTLVRKGRIEGVGELEIRMELKNNVIKEANIMGDYFLVGDIDNRLLKMLHNVPLTEEDIAKALPEKLDDIILNLQKEDFVKLITRNK